MNKKRFIPMLLIFTLVFTWLGYYSGHANAAGCSGANCLEQDPGIMGCSASTSGTIAYLPDGLSTVETRVSGASSCNAKWARVYNKSGTNQWVAADLKCNPPNYGSCQFKASQAQIASSSSVGIYTMMQPYASSLVRSCGVVRGAPGPITSVPLSSLNCTSTN